MRVSLSNKVSGLALIFFIYRKNHTHEGGHTSEFPLDIYWWTLKNPKNQNFEENVKKKCWRYYHFTRVYQKPQSYEVIRYSSWDTGWNRIFLSFWAIFCPFTPPTRNNQENQNFEKMKEASGDVIILNLCTKSTIIWCVYSDME